MRLIILDEFQHFVDKDSWRVLKNVSDWLKNLIDETEVPIVLIGMPYAVEILDAPGNEQLQRRFSVRCATNGRVGKIMKVVRKATELALDADLEHLTLDVLADAYDERLMADRPRMSNPFRSEREALKVVPFEEPQMNFAAMSRRSRRKAREEVASFVLCK